MNVIDMTNKLKINKIELVQGDYEGFKYFKLVAYTDRGVKLCTKLTEFEYNVLSKS